MQLISGVFLPGVPFVGCRLFRLVGSFLLSKTPSSPLGCSMEISLIPPPTLRPASACGFLQRFWGTWLGSLMTENTEFYSV